MKLLVIRSVDVTASGERTLDTVYQDAGARR